MFILDSLMISGISWTLKTVLTAAEAEMNDDSALREALLEAEMRREMGEISDDEFGEIEAELLGRIREIKERREGGSGPLAFGAEPIDTSGDNRFQIEASVSGDFHDPADAPHTTIVDHDSGEGALVATDIDRHIQVMDMTPGEATGPELASLPTTPNSRRQRPRAGRAVRATPAKPSRISRASRERRRARAR